MTRPPNLRTLSPATRAAQALRHIDARTGAVTPGIELSSTFARDAGYAPRQSYIYARDGGPTVEHAEALLAELDGAAGALVFASGMAALVALMETLRIGDHVAAPRSMYHGGIAWLRRLGERRGIETTFFDATEPGALEAALRPGRTRLLWIESPTNPTWDVIDVGAAAGAAHAAGARLAVDCTVAPPCTMRALELGADIAFHSGTKYLGGHSDLTAGVLCLARRDALWDELRQVRYLMGSVIAAFEAWLLIRGLRTLYLRYERASANALAVAQGLRAHPGVERVLYPGLPEHSGHAIAARQMIGGFGGMLSILVRGGEAQARDVARFTQVFVPATSLGGVESLIEHRRAVEGPDLLTPANLLRLSIGIEDAGDLIADLEAALERAGCWRLSQPPRDPAFVQDPYPFYDRARAAGPLFFWEEYGFPCAAGYGAVNALLRDRRFGREPPADLRPARPAHLADFYALDDLSMLDREPPAHTRLRGLVLRAFTSRRIAALGPEIAVLARDLVDRIDGPEFDLLPAFAERLPVIVIARLLGVPEDGADQLLGWSHAMVAMYQARRDRAAEDAANAAARDFAAFLRGQIAARRAAPADDLLTHLIAAETDGERLSTDELIATCVLLLNAGHEATVHAIGNGVAAILTAGLDPSRLFASDAAAAATVEELLRFDPPLHLFTRIALQDVEVYGQPIRRGDTIGCLLGAANRDPAAYPAPGRLDPERSGPPQLAFGAGLHFCVGAPLARLELATALPILFARLPGLALTEAPAFADRYHFRGLTRLRLRARGGNRHATSGVPTRGS